MIKDVFININVVRELIKICVMTLPYNVKLEGMTKQITDRFTKVFMSDNSGGKKLYFIVPAKYTKNKKDMEITGQQAGLFGSLVYRTILKFISPVDQLREYILGIISVFRNLNKPIYWVSPSGMKI